jgi:hypothetical protein
MDAHHAVPLDDFPLDTIAFLSMPPPRSCYLSTSISIWMTFSAANGDAAAPFDRSISAQARVTQLQGVAKLRAGCG